MQIKFFFKTIQLCIGCWKNFDYYQDARYVRKKLSLCLWKSVIKCCIWILFWDMHKHV